MASQTTSETHTHIHTHLSCCAYAQFDQLQCQQQLSEMAASSKVASTTSEIYTRALSQTVALRMSHANEMEELQLVMEEKVRDRKSVDLILGLRFFLHLPLPSQVSASWRV